MQSANQESSVICLNWMCMVVNQMKEAHISLYVFLPTQLISRSTSLSRSITSDKQFSLKFKLKFDRLWLTFPWNIIHFRNNLKDFVDKTMEKIVGKAFLWLGVCFFGLMIFAHISTDRLIDFAFKTINFTNINYIPVRKLIFFQIELSVP